MAIALVVIEAATVLWVRQSDTALLRVNSYGGAISEVALFAAPTLLLYVLVIRQTVMVATVALLVGLLLGISWWSSATDWHSTASLGPGFIGWLFGPLVVGLAAATEAVLRHRRNP